MMRLVFRSVTGLNTAIAVWLSAMFLILRHADATRNAMIALIIAIFCALAFWSVRRDAPAWLRSTALVGSLLLGMAGLWAIYQDLQPNADFEGFVLIVGAAWTIQGVAAFAAARTATARS